MVDRLHSVQHTAKALAGYTVAAGRGMTTAVLISFLLFLWTHYQQGLMD